MEETAPLFLEVLLILGGGIVAGTLFKRIGLGTVLGYLFAGIVLGPVLRVIESGKGEILHIGELGVVFLLFIIGLELKLSRLWSLRRQIFGLGLAQVLLTGAVLAGLLMLLPLGWRAASVIGFGLALSSTAFALQLLQESGSLNTRFGQASFSVLLFQDLAIVPLLALLPVLAPGGGAEAAAGIDPVAIAKSFGALLLLVLAGRYLINPLFRVLANAGAREVMIAAALFVVLASALLMGLAGFSMAMGSFIAGVLLAESSYRHELEANIDPFRGLLLGLFFIAVGLSLDIAVIRDNWWIILLGAPALMAVKAAILYPLCRVFGENHANALRTSLVLPQGGEFAFVLFSAASGAAIFDGAVGSLLVAVVTLSMALTPLTAYLGRRLTEEEDDEGEQLEEDFEGAGSDILMIGFSRFGQMAAQVLLSSGLEMTILDSSAERIKTAGRFGFRIYFGSGLRREVLEAAGIRQAKIVAVCTNKPEVTNQIVDLIRSEFPNVSLFVRSYDRNHSLVLRERGVSFEIRETLESALRFGGQTLEELGFETARVREIVEDVRKRDAERLVLQQARGLGAGGSVFAPNKATPEPLVKPRAGRDGEPAGPKRRPRGQKPLSVRLAEESAAAD
ncbi:monovalent cation:proton antiporter-2 (CPA2) family protein [Aureimonas pseudogalii]|uniref:CPA2 family monovalent cation:H+ antiporter-2 n=1 Tax=Aureimonas pseudogalii TaxID=1744844 RepID=A0A7W6EDF2_9HYPH|nr:monovalent cation:proton antiporter-2 (CPA2) family protein [Aureimonas pseudogalii]MBB3996630.1 CPA2 family monovalent cation:H+ antiporter-2 [Aureimonas pseudogalii]